MSSSVRITGTWHMAHNTFNMEQVKHETKFEAQRRRIKEHAKNVRLQQSHCINAIFPAPLPRKYHWETLATMNSGLLCIPIACERIYNGYLLLYFYDHWLTDQTKAKCVDVVYHYIRWLAIFSEREEENDSWRRQVVGNITFCGTGNVK